MVWDSDDSEIAMALGNACKRFTEYTIGKSAEIVVSCETSNGIKIALIKDKSSYKILSDYQFSNGLLIWNNEISIYEVSSLSYEKRWNETFFEAVEEYKKLLVTNIL